MPELFFLLNHGLVTKPIQNRWSFENWMDREGYYFLQKSSLKTQEARDCCEIFMASYWLAAVKLINFSHLHRMG